MAPIHGNGTAADPSKKSKPTPTSSATSRGHSSKPTSAPTPTLRLPTSAVSKHAPKDASSQAQHTSRSSSKSPLNTQTSSSTSTRDTFTPPGSNNSSRRSSVVLLDSSAYRYSLNVGSISRFPTAVSPGGNGSGANQVLAQTQSRDRQHAPRTDSANAKSNSKDPNAILIDPSRASYSSTSSRGSRLSSRYTAEEVAPQRRPLFLTLPSDPSAPGPWTTASSNSGKNKGKSSDEASSTNLESSPQQSQQQQNGSRNSKIMTTFPFPHPVTPRRKNDSTRTGTGRGSSTWQRILTALFAGPYERRLIREEEQDDELTQSIIQGIAGRRGSASENILGNGPAPPSVPNYGSIPAQPAKSGALRKNGVADPAADVSDESIDPSDPYGYRRLAGPHLLPSYTTDLATRRRERRRARSRARFQCMALWTIWTVSILLIIIVALCLVSFEFPQRFPLPGGSPQDGEEADQSLSSSSTSATNHFSPLVLGLFFILHLLDSIPHLQLLSSSH